RKDHGQRTLYAVARENMVEGCVRETFGALIAAWQASHAADPEIAQALDEIARDELRHAPLSWQIASWSATQVDDEERVAITKARDEAITTLFAETEIVHHPEIVTKGGLPSGTIQKRMLREMCATLWAA